MNEKKGSPGKGTLCVQRKGAQKTEGGVCVCLHVYICVCVCVSVNSKCSATVRTKGQIPRAGGWGRKVGDRR